MVSVEQDINVCYYFILIVISVLSVSRIGINYDDLEASKPVTFPNYKDERLSVINDTWDQPTDSITLPSNFFDFTTKGKNF